MQGSSFSPSGIPLVAGLALRYPLSRSGVFQYETNRLTLMANDHNLRKTGGPGRPKGSVNKSTQEAKEFAASILGDPIYQASLLTRVKMGTLPPQIETLLYYYRYGKPRERLEITVESPVTGEDLTQLSLEQIAERNARLQAELLQEIEAEKMAEATLAQKRLVDFQNSVLDEKLGGGGKVM